MAVDNLNLELRIDDSKAKRQLADIEKKYNKLTKTPISPKVSKQTLADVEKLEKKVQGLGKDTVIKPKVSKKAEEDIDRLQRKLRKLGATKLTNLGKGFDRLGSRLDTIAGKLTRVNKLVTAGIATGLALGLKNSVQNAISFESAFAGVVKTTEGLTSAPGVLNDAGKALRSEFEALSKVIPLTFEELAGIGEVAGQFGIAKEELIEFTKTAAALGVTTNLSGQQAAESIAQIFNVLDDGSQTASEFTERLGSVIVDLGNNSATTEADILAFTQRIAASGKIAGVSAKEIAAISAAAGSVGVNVEAGGTAIQKTLTAMAVAVSTGSEELGVFGETAGISGAEFKQAFEKDAAGAFESFVSGLGKQGAKSSLILEELGLGNERVFTTMASLAAGGDLVGESINRANKAWEENNALTKEAAERYASSESQLNLIKNRLRLVSVELGSRLLPAVTKFATKFAEAVERNGDKIQEFGDSLVDAIDKIDMDELIDGMISFTNAIFKAVPQLIKFGGILLKIFGLGNSGSGLRNILALLTVGSPLIRGVGLLSKGMGGLLRTFSKNQSAATGLGKALSSFSSGGAASGGGLIKLLSNPYVLGGAVVIGGIAGAIYLLNKRLTRLSIGEQNTKNLNTALTKLAEEGITLSEGSMAKLNGELDQLTSQGVVLTVDQLNDRLQRQADLAKLTSDRFAELRASGVPAEEALKQAIEDTNSSIEEQNTLNAAREAFARRQIREQQTQLNVRDEKFGFDDNRSFEDAVQGSGRDAITGNTNLRNDLSNLSFGDGVFAGINDQAAFDTALSGLKAKMASLGTTGRKEFLENIKIDTTTGLVDLSEVQGLDEGQKSLLKTTIQNDLREVYSEYEFDEPFKMKIGDAEIEASNIQELFDNIEAQFGQQDPISLAESFALTLDPDSTATEVQFALEQIKAAVSDQAERTRIFEDIFSRLQFDEGQLAGLKAAGLGAGEVLSGALSSGFIDNIGTFEQKAAAINLILQEMTGDKTINITGANTEEVTAQINALDLKVDDATKERLINILADGGQAKDEAAAVGQATDEATKDKEGKLTLNGTQAKNEAGAVASAAAEATQNRSGFLSFASNIGGVVAAARNAIANVTGNAGGGTIYRAGGGIVPQYLNDGGFARKGTDTVPAMLTPGEFVLTRPAASTIGRQYLNQLNNVRSSGDLVKLSKALLAKTGASVPTYNPTGVAAGGVSGSVDNSRRLNTDITVNNYSAASERNSYYSFGGMLGRAA